MDSKKRRIDGVEGGVPGGKELVEKLLAPFTPAQISELLAEICTALPEAFDILEAAADRSITHRKVFVRGIPWSTTEDSLEKVFNKFGDLAEVSIIMDKKTG